jgi:4-diphosphocytidyl-2-C-methyl-D-erythritol kinase
MTTLTETAYAKINLALHVRARREDGYHELETFFAFVDAGDEIAVTQEDSDLLTITGEFAPLLAGEEGNLVLDALALLPRAQGWHVSLDKALPVAAGLGGARRMWARCSGWLSARMACPMAGSRPPPSWAPMCPPAWRAWR